MCSALFAWTPPATLPLKYIFCVSSSAAASAFAGVSAPKTSSVKSAKLITSSAISSTLSSNKSAAGRAAGCGIALHGPVCRKSISFNLTDLRSPEAVFMVYLSLAISATTAPLFLYKTNELTFIIIAVSCFTDFLFFLLINLVPYYKSFNFE